MQSFNGAWVVRYSKNYIYLTVKKSKDGGLVFAHPTRLLLLILQRRDQNTRLKEWVGHVKETLDVWERVPTMDLASKHRPWEL